MQKKKPLNITFPGDKRLLLAGALLYLALLVVHLFIQPYADDLWYAEKAAGKGLFPLLWDFYLGWSGRLASNALAFLLTGGGFWVWRLLNPAFILALVWLMARVAGPQPKGKTLCLSLALLLMAGPGVLDYAVFWATGSLYYLWPAVGALVALMPFLDLALRGEGTIRFFPLRLALAVLCALCNEQLTACMLGFMAVILGWKIVKARALKPLGRHLAMLLSAIPAALVLLLAPGSRLRYEHESYQYYLQYFTGFYEVPVPEKIGNGLAWMMDGLVVCLLLLLLWLFAFAWRRRYGGDGSGILQGQAPGKAATKGRERLRWPLLGLLCLAAAASFGAPPEPLVTFARPEAFADFSVAGWLLALAPYLFWGLVLAALVGLLWKGHWLYAVSFLAALASIAVLFFSPTIYASGPRTLFFAVVILCVLVVRLAPKPLTPPVLLLAGAFALWNTLKLISRLTLFM